MSIRRHGKGHEFDWLGHMPEQGHGNAHDDHKLAATPEEAEQIFNEALQRELQKANDMPKTESTPLKAPIPNFESAKKPPAIKTKGIGDRRQIDRTPVWEPEVVPVKVAEMPSNDFGTEGITQRSRPKPPSRRELTEEQHEAASRASREGFVTQFVNGKVDVKSLSPDAMNKLVGELRLRLDPIEFALGTIRNEYLRRMSELRKLSGMDFPTDANIDIR